MKQQIYLSLSLMMVSFTCFGQQAAWDAIKADAAPVLTAAFADVFSPPEMVPVADYGWYDITLFDIYGKALCDTHITDIQTQFDISSFSTGTYYVEVIDK